MKRGTITIVICATLSVLSCSKEHVKGNGSYVTETRNVSNFTAVSSSGSTNVHISQGNSFSVEVKGAANLLPYYETKLVNSTLQLGFKQNVNVKNDNTEVFITMPVLNGLALYGSGDINANGSFNGNASFDARISGSGNIHIAAGSAQQFFGSIAGSGNIYALDLIAGIAETNTEGSGNTEITASNQLKVKIAGSGNVYYRGTPAISTTISGSGKVLPK